MRSYPSYRQRRQAVYDAIEREHRLESRLESRLAGNRTRDLPPVEDTRDPIEIARAANAALKGAR